MTFLLPIFHDFQYFHAQPLQPSRSSEILFESKQFAVSFDQNSRNKRVPTCSSREIYFRFPPRRYYGVLWKKLWQQRQRTFLVPSFPSNSSYTDNFLIEIDEKTSRFPDECIKYRTRNVFFCNFPFSNSCFPNGNVFKSEMVNTAVRTTDENFLSKPPPRSSVLIPSKILIHFIRFYDRYRAACEMFKKKVNSCSE